MAFLQDLRFGVRMLCKSPAFFTLAVVTLAVAIGANTAIFSVADAVLLRPMPYPQANRLVVLDAGLKSDPAELRPFSWSQFEFLSKGQRSFKAFAAFSTEVFNLTGRGEPEQVRAARVTESFFDVVSVPMQLGRGFRAGEDRPGAAYVAVLSHSFWQRRFAAQTTVLGQSVTLDSVDYTIIGVLPPRFEFPLTGSTVPDIWVPRAFELNALTPAQVQAGAGYLTGIGRLRNGVALEQAQAEIDLLGSEYRLANPEKADARPDTTTKLSDLHARTVANVRPVLIVLIAAAAFLLLIACANVTTVCISRALERRKEMAIRAALGATSSRISRQFVTETAIVGIIAGACGLLLSLCATKALAAFAKSYLPNGSFTFNWKVLAFTASISCIVACTCGLISSLAIMRTHPERSLRDDARGSVGARTRTLGRNMLVIAQVALCMVLLVGSGLILRTFLLLARAGLGCDSTNVLTMSISLSHAKYGSGPRMLAFYRQLLEQVQQVPGIQAVGISSALPANSSRLTPTLMEGQPQSMSLSERPIVALETVSPEYLIAIRARLLRGRHFTSHDDASAPPVALVNDALAKRYWPGETALGKRLWIGRMTSPTQIVGVIADIKNLSLAQDAQPEIFLPYPQRPWPTLILCVRTAQEPHSVITAVRTAISKVDRDQSVTAIQTMDDVLAAAIAPTRFSGLIVGSFAAVALLLALAGIYGVVAHSVSQRRHEFGVRIAIGAAESDIVRLVVSNGLTLSSAGIVLGIPAALALTRLMSSLLYRVSAADPLTFSVMAAGFILLALLASYLPARGAARLNPAQNLLA